MDLLLYPDQMMLQIHESIGHPLELDRILGDERNYAGTSFDAGLFGSYKYGSELLNVTFDPSIDAELASYGYDDHGTKAEKTSLHQGRHSQAAAGRRDLPETRQHWWGGQLPCLLVEPSANGPHGQSQCRARHPEHRRASSARSSVGC